MNHRFIFRDKDRHGNLRVYVRRYGRRIRIYETPGTIAFDRAYAAALVDLGLDTSSNTVPTRKHLLRGSLGWLAAVYFSSAEFTALDLRSQRVRRNVIECCLSESHHSELLRNCSLEKLSAAKLKCVRDARREHPAAANNRLKYLSAMFGWAVEAGAMAANPAR